MRQRRIPPPGANGLPGPHAEASHHLAIGIRYRIGCVAPRIVCAVRQGAAIPVRRAQHVAKVHCLPVLYRLVYREARCIQRQVHPNRRVSHHIIGFMYGLQNPSFPHRNALPAKAAAARWLQPGKLDHQLFACCKIKPGGRQHPVIQRRSHFGAVLHRLAPPLRGLVHRPVLQPRTAGIQLRCQGIADHRVCPARFAAGFQAQGVAARGIVPGCAGIQLPAGLFLLRVLLYRGDGRQFHLLQNGIQPLPQRCGELCPQFHPALVRKAVQIGLQCFAVFRCQNRPVKAFRLRRQPGFLCLGLNRGCCPQQKHHRQTDPRPLH